MTLAFTAERQKKEARMKREKREKKEKPDTKVRLLKWLKESAILACRYFNL